MNAFEQAVEAGAKARELSGMPHERLDTARVVLTAALPFLLAHVVDPETKVPCGECEGKGEVWTGVDDGIQCVYDACPRCDGSGSLPAAVVMMDLLVEKGWLVQVSTMRDDDSSLLRTIPVYRRTDPRSV